MQLTSSVRLAATTVLSTMASSLPSSSRTTLQSPVAMHWFRKGLRLHDNPGLVKSIEIASGKVYPVYVLDGDSYQLAHSSALRANFLVECLADLDQSLRQVGSRLYVATGDPAVVLPELWERWNVTHLTYDADETGEPYAVERDANVHSAAATANNRVSVESFCTETLFSLEDYVSKCSSSNDPTKIPITMGSFQTLFAKMGPLDQPLPAPSKGEFSTLLPVGDDDVNVDAGSSHDMRPPKKATNLPWPRNTPKQNVTPIWGPKDIKQGQLDPMVRGGEQNALEQLYTTITTQPSYTASFEKPKTSCTSVKKASTTVLSPYMSLGCVSPRTVWFAIQEATDKASPSTNKSKPPVSLHGQLLWRDFNNLLAHSANKQHSSSWGVIHKNPFCRQTIPWSSDPAFQEAWKTGQTGYPWIDACMTQLNTQGWIHHLGRHAVACFLTRGDLWQSWEVGAAHFESQLLDADYAVNGFNWLWLSCSGFFYQYFRCYSPVAFQKKNDPTGKYIRKWIPSLRNLPDKYIYEPWKAPIAVQKDAGVKIGIDYPKRIVDDHTYVSKENMSKMAYAYDLHKEQIKGGANQKKSKSTGTATASKKGEPAKKKQKKQSKLAFKK